MRVACRVGAVRAGAAESVRLVGARARTENVTARGEGRAPPPVNYWPLAKDAEKAEVECRLNRGPQKRGKVGYELVDGSMEHVPPGAVAGIVCGMCLSARDDFGGGAGNHGAQGNGPGSACGCSGGRRSSWCSRGVRLGEAMPQKRADRQQAGLSCQPRGA